MCADIHSLMGLTIDRRDEMFSKSEFHFIHYRTPNGRTDVP
jgi:hypothetical protein